MKFQSGHLKAKDFISSLAANGRYHFVSSEAQSALGASPSATKLALNRLAKQQLLASPARGFYVILPPEYRSLGCLPADQFIPALMEHLGQPYYVGLLSAAQYYGAAHHRPQEFQVVTEKSHRPIQCGAVRVVFVTKKGLKDVPVQSFNTPRGTILVSTPEATAIDIIGYPDHAGGLDHAATILAELAEKIDSDKLVLAAKTAPIAWLQRLGYLLEEVVGSEKSASLKIYVRKNVRKILPLLPGKAHIDFPRNEDWKLYINADIEVEL